jgi:UDP-N-acetylglucosamine diphosphorylase/glucosamine-1-phosphate N-acetyltransferase
MKNKELKAIVLAAGKGTRLQTEGNTLPKVMRIAAGKPLLSHVLGALDFIKSQDCVIVVGYKKDYVTEAFPDYVFAEQTEQLGTGHAVMAAFSQLADYDGSLLVCCGDMPLIRQETYLALVKEHEEKGNSCTILSGTSEVYLPYGRIVRDEKGDFIGMVEEKDASEKQKEIKELNSGVYVFDAKALSQVLSMLKSDNAQGEYYLTDAPLLLKNKGYKVGVLSRRLGHEIIGVNTIEQLREVEELLLK